MCLLRLYGICSLKKKRLYGYNFGANELTKHTQLTVDSYASMYLRLLWLGHNELAWIETAIHVL